MSNYEAMRERADFDAIVRLFKGDGLTKKDFTWVNDHEIIEILVKSDFNDCLSYDGFRDVEGTFANIYTDTESGIRYAVETVPCVFIRDEYGLSEFDVKRVRWFVERYGHAFLGSNANPKDYKHLAQLLADKLPQFRFEFKCNRHCDIYKE